MSRLGNLGARLYRGEVGYDFIGKRKIWYGVSILITITAILGLAVSGLNMGIEFKGGAVFTTDTKAKVSVSQAHEDAVEASGHEAIVQELGNGGLRIQITEVDTKKADQIKTQLAEDLGIPEAKINADLVGPSWGEQIANKAWAGLGIFMVLVVVYLAIAFEWRMAVAALIALIHDITITVGVYALVGFEVTPGTVIGLLTILGYSLYDTVVVFDSLKEGTNGITKQTRWTYSEIANRSINGTLVRSINTTVVALLPVAGLLFIGGGVLGAGMLNDISLSLFVGLAAGAYSSIFIATPLVADLKEREPQIKALKKRILAKRAAAAAKGESVEDERDDLADDDSEPRVPWSVSAASRAVTAGPRGTADDRHERHRHDPGAAAQPDPRRTGLSEARSAVQGHHPLLADPVAFTALTDFFVELCARHGATKVVGLEARGFILAAPVAVRAGLGFVPVRKAGKLPGATLGQAYELEYGTAEIEIHAEDLSADDRVMVIDDVLATGGTAEASLELIRRAGAQVAGVSVLMELGFLAGRDRLGAGLREAPLEALITL